MLVLPKCDAQSKAWDILLVLTSVAGNLCNKCPSGYSNKTAVKVILSMQSLVSIKQQSPRRPCDILVASVGPEVAKTAKTVKCVKKCAKLKMFKTALSGVSQQSSCQGMCQCSVCVRVLYQPVQACSGPEALPLPSCPEAQGECLSFRELPREVTGPRSLDSAQGCAQEEHMAIFTSSP